MSYKFGYFIINCHINFLSSTLRLVSKLPNCLQLDLKTNGPFAAFHCCSTVYTMFYWFWNGSTVWNM